MRMLPPTSVRAGASAPRASWRRVPRAGDSTRSICAPPGFKTNNSDSDSIMLTVPPSDGCSEACAAPLASTRRSVLEETLEGASTRASYCRSTESALTSIRWPASVDVNLALPEPRERASSPPMSNSTSSRDAENAVRRSAMLSPPRALTPSIRRMRPSDIKTTPLSHSSQPAPCSIRAPRASSIRAPSSV